MMKKVIAATGCVAILLGIAPLSIAQQQRLGGQPGQPDLQQDRPLGQERQLGQQQQARGQTGQLDEKLAAWLACGNRAEVELGQLATEKASDPQVRQFAQRMVQEHTQLLQQLKQINPEIETPDSAQQGGQRFGQQTQQRAQPGQQAGQSGQQQPGQFGQQPGQAGQRLGQQAQQRGTGDASDQLMEIGKQASERKVELTKTFLQDKQGEEFDKCYMGSQIAAHIAMVAELEAMQDAGSPQLQQIVSKASQSTQQHLQEAQQIAQKLEGGEGAAARLSQRPGQPDRTDRTEQPQRPDEDR